MNNYKRVTSILKFIIAIAVLFIVLLIASLFYEDNEKKDNTIHDIEKSTINDSNEKYSINVSYPRFKDTKLNEIITNYIYPYIKEFKDNKKESKTLNIDYEIYVKDNYLNIVFNINNSLNNIKHHNIIINTDKKEVSYISNLYNKDYLKNEILDLVYYKYKNEIYNKVKDVNINNLTYVIDDKNITVYFYNIDFNNIKYIPNVKISLTNEKVVFDDIEYTEGTKYIAFTFDDGPSEYTTEILKTLELNESTATFFMLGNKMKYNEDIVKEIYNSNSEIASHSYSHKYLTKINDDELLNEINSPQLIMNEITNGNISYLRPPYGEYNNKVLTTSPYPLILWNIDPKDWLVKDSDKIYNNIITYACDGCIVLLHDVYKETTEAVKKVIPSLKSMGYEIVSITDLIKVKDVKLDKNNVIRSIKNN